MLILSLCYRAPRRWPCAQLSLCQCARSACDQLFVAQAFAAILAQQLKLLARVHRSIAAALGYCTLCHLFAHHQLLVSVFRTCRRAVSRQSAPRRSRPVGALFFSSAFTYASARQLKKGHPRSPFAPRRAQRTCALQTSDHRSAAVEPRADQLLRSRVSSSAKTPSSP